MLSDCQNLNRLTGYRGHIVVQGWGWLQGLQELCWCMAGCLVTQTCCARLGLASRPSRTVLVYGRLNICCSTCGLSANFCHMLSNSGTLAPPNNSYPHHSTRTTTNSDAQMPLVDLTYFTVSLLRCAIHWH